MENFAKILSTIQNELASGLLCIHTHINANTSKTMKAPSFLYALIELLNEKGLISIGDFDNRKKTSGVTTRKEVCRKWYGSEVSESRFAGI